MTSAAKYAELRRETSSAFDKLGLFLADLCEGSDAHDTSSEKPNLDSRLGSFYQTFTALKTRHADQNLTVAVLALTKSGKRLSPNYLVLASHCFSFRKLRCSLLQAKSPVGILWPQPTSMLCKLHFAI